MRKNERAERLLLEWVEWSRVHRFFGPPIPPSILALLAYKNKMSRDPPDGALSAEISALHVALVSLPKDKLLPLLRVYLGFPNRPIKWMAYEIGIDRDTYYNRAHKAADDLMRNTNSVMAMVENLGLLKNSGLNDRNFSKNSATPILETED